MVDSRLFVFLVAINFIVSILEILFGSASFYNFFTLDLLMDFIFMGLRVTFLPLTREECVLAFCYYASHLYHKLWLPEQ